MDCSFCLLYLHDFHYMNLNMFELLLVILSFETGKLGWLHMLVRYALQRCLICYGYRQLQCHLITVFQTRLELTASLFFFFFLLVYWGSYILVLH